MKKKTQTTYLNGKIMIESLATKADSFGRFRGRDERGEVAMIVSGFEINHIEYAEFMSRDVKRGFHYHKKYREQLYVVTGAVYLKACIVDDPEHSITITLNVGNIAVIEPGVAHAFKAMKKSQVLSMGTGPSPFHDRYLYDELFFDEVETETKKTK